MLTHHQWDSQDNEFSHDITSHNKSEDKAQRQKDNRQGIIGRYCINWGDKQDKIYSEKI